jgi:A/G-specific adenine glycosylase
MLQQTQVATVRAYYERFVERFPDVQGLAQAPLDDVLGMWSGLGYYRRARNLHRCAQLIVSHHHGVFPCTSVVLQTLPGIGKSTAAAIASLCFGERVAILDANVKRVLVRWLGFDADLSQAANQRSLWNAASRLLPLPAVASACMPRYTQGVMDLGATVCLSRNPLCHACPVQQGCHAAAAGNPQRYPVRSRTLKRSSHSIWLLWLESADQSVWLTKRPSAGVWGGLYCMPAFESEEELLRWIPVAMQPRLRAFASFRHILTHKDLTLHPRGLTISDTSSPLGQGQWFEASKWSGLGLPAPIRKLLQSAEI